MKIANPILPLPAFYLLAIIFFLVGCSSRLPPADAPAAEAAKVPATPTAVAPATDLPIATQAVAETSIPTPTPVITAEPSPTVAPTEIIENETGDVPTPGLFSVAWDDRSLFKKGLIETQQQILDELPGASIYHINFQIAGDLVHLQGEQEVRYTNLEDEPLSEIYFRLFPNLTGGSSAVSGLMVNNEPVEPIYEMQHSAMRVPLSPALAPGRQVVIKMTFTVEIPDRSGGNYGTFAFLDGVLALAHFYPMIAVYDDEGWNVEIAPEIGDIVYADSSFYLARITAPASLTVAASGVEVDRQQNGDTQIITIAAGPMRDFYVAASQQYQLTTRVIGETTINSFAPANLDSASKVVIDYTENALLSFNRRFGPYPFTEFDIVSTTTSALGIEYPGIVAILADLYQEPNSPLMEAVVAHEVAHQWFYSVIGNDQIDEPWIDEAMAQFATIVYFSDVHGPTAADGFRRSLEGRWERVDGSKIPIGLPVRDYTPQEYSSIVYGRGPIFIEALAEEMGQESFAAFLLDYYQTNQWGIATGASFKQLAEQHCACDLTPLFETWVYDSTTN